MQKVATFKIINIEIGTLSLSRQVKTRRRAHITDRCRIVVGGELASKVERKQRHWIVFLVKGKMLRKAKENEDGCAYNYNYNYNYNIHMDPDSTT